VADGPRLEVSASARHYEPTLEVAWTSGLPLPTGDDSSCRLPKNHSTPPLLVL
jgi:hypothetical protein